MTLISRIKIEFKNFALLFQRRDKILIFAAIMLISLVFVAFAPATNALELLALDWKSAFYTNWINTEAAVDTIIVAIDSKTLRDAPEKWPWPQDYWAEVIKLVSEKLAPQVVVLDISFQDNNGDQAASERFASEIKKSGNVGLVAVFEENSSTRGQALKFFPPIKALAAAARFWGMSQFPNDADGVIRSFLLYDFRMEKLHVAWEACKILPNFSRNEKVFQSMKTAKAILNFKSDERRIQSIPLDRVLSDKFNEPNLKGKNVIIGATARILHDYHQTPVGIISGPELVGNAIDTLMRDRVQFLDPSWQNRLCHFIAALFLAFIPFLDFFKKTWVPVSLGIVVLPLVLLGYSFFPAVHPPVALSYIAFVFFSMALLVLFRLNELNSIQQSLHEAEICGNIQQKFFPAKVLNIEPGFCAGGRCIPYQDAGGDYYDYFQNKEGNVFFFLGDVAGHGISASMLTTAAKSVVIINSSKPGFGVNDVFLDINSAILSLTSRRMMSAVAGIVNFKEGKITISSAGHLPAVLKFPGGIKEIEIAGFPMGVSKRFQLKDSVDIEIPDYGKLFVYSDGMIEAVNWKNEQWGFDKFFEIIDKMPMELTVEESLDYLYKQLDLYVEGRDYQDDVTVIVMSFAKGEIKQCLS